ncbi:MAG: response regulator transcription factor [Nitrospira sp.]|nr:response regulator transcription factor [Nitrospira sp.]
MVVLTADKALAEYLQTALRRVGYATFWATTTCHVFSISRRLAPSLILMDCQIREWPVIRTEPTFRRVPLIAVVPADCSYPEDRCLEDLACGIDGVHHVKDGLRLLIATVDAHLRRLKGFAPSRGICRVGAVELDADAHDLQIAGRPVRLSAKPFAILKALMQSYPAVCRRDELLARIWGPGFAIGPRVLDTHIHVIRTLLAQHSQSRCHVVTVRKVGFKLEIGRERRMLFSRSASEQIRLTGDDPGCVPRHPVEMATVAAARPFMSVTKKSVRPDRGRPAIEQACHLFRHHSLGRRR